MTSFFRCIFSVFLELKVLGQLYIVLKRLFFVGRHVRLQGFWVFEILAANATLELHILC